MKTNCYISHVSILFNKNCTPTQAIAKPITGFVEMPVAVLIRRVEWDIQVSKDVLRFSECCTIGDHSPYTG